MKRSLITPLKRLLFMLLLCCASFIPSKLFAANDASPWFKNSDPEFSLRKEIVSDAEYPSTYAQRGNIDCDVLTFTKRDGDLSPFLPLHRESQVSGCYINTGVSPVDPNGFVNVSGTNYIAEAVRSNNTPTSFFAFPNTDLFISNATGAPAVGTYVWFDHLITSLKYTKDNFGRIRAVINPQAQISLADAAGNKLPVMSDNFGISDNGEWAIVDSPGRAMLRINLITMEVLPFTSSFEFGNGIGAAIRTAITSDGRYAVVASKNYNFFKVFDLSTCGIVPSTITAPVSGCQSRDLNQFARGKINSMGGVLQIRFLTNNLLKFYASYDVTSTSRIGAFIIAAPNTYLTGMDYLAMGDSFSSGEGAQKYELGTDEKDFNLCHLSRVSYPYLIAKRIKANNFHSVACSGTKTTNVSGGSGVDNKAIRIDRDNQYRPDFKPPNNSLGDWLPGYKKQIGFISINNPGIVTVSVGGNDIGFADKLIACLKPFTCFPSYEDRQEVFNEVDSKLTALAATFKKTKDFATKNARIYVIGYPQIALPAGSCGLNVHLNKEELVFAASLITRLDTVIKTAAEQAGVNYIDIEDAFNGYRLCENNSGNIAMNGLTAGNDKAGIIGNESYHPNEFGHELMANKILGLTNNLGTLNPTPNPAAKVAKIKDTDEALKSAPKTNRPLNKRVTTSASSKTVKKGKKVTIPLKGATHSLPPNTSYTVSIDGNPVGTVTTDDNGDANVEVTIPPDTESGPVIIDITGTDVTGQPIDIGTVVTVGNDGPDFDGDGIPDPQDSCPAIANSMVVDVDQDGIDDACDGFIGLAPTVPETPANSNSNIVSTASITTGGSNSNGPHVAGLDTPDGGSPQQTSVLAEAGRVLTEHNFSAESINPMPMAKAALEALRQEAGAHPVNFLLLLVGLVILLIQLLWKYARSLSRQYIYSVNT